MIIRSWGDHDYGTAVREDGISKEVAEVMKSVLKDEKGVDFRITGEGQNNQVRFSFDGRKLTPNEMLWMSQILGIENPDEWVVRPRRVS